MAAGVAVDARKPLVRVAAGDEALNDLLLDRASEPARPNASIVDARTWQVAIGASIPPG